MGAQNFRWGVRDGLGFSSLIGVEGSLPLVGIYAGFTADYLLSDKWSIGMDFTISEQGSFMSDDSADTFMTYTYDYLNVPLMAQYTLPLDNGQKLLFEAGVQLGIFLVANCEWEAPSILGDGYVSGEDFLDRDSFHPLEYGALLGVEWFLGDFSLEFRYTMGITQTHNGISQMINDYIYISIPDSRNSVAQLGMNYYF